MNSTVPCGLFSLIARLEIKCYWNGTPCCWYGKETNDSVDSVSVWEMQCVPSLQPPASLSLSLTRGRGWVTSTEILQELDFLTTWPCFLSSRPGMIQGQLVYSSTAAWSKSYKSFSTLLFYPWRGFLGWLWVALSLLFCICRMGGEEAEIRFCEHKRLSMATLRMTWEAKVQLKEILVNSGFPEGKMLCECNQFGWGFVLFTLLRLRILIAGLRWIS